MSDVPLAMGMEIVSSSFTAEAGKAWPAGYIQPTACFCSNELVWSSGLK